VTGKQQTVHTDVLIIGGGVVGMSIARQLHKSGVSDVTVIDQGVCGREASWAAAGMLSPQAETDELGPFFQFCSRSRDMYPDFSEELLQETGIDIGLDRTGTIYIERSDDAGGEVLQRYRKQRDAGLDVELLSTEDVMRLEPHTSEFGGRGVLFPGDWQVDNRELVQALRRYAEINGIGIIENTAAKALLTDSEEVMGVRTSAGEIHASHTVLAAGAWTSLVDLGPIAARIQVEPVKGQIVCVTARPGVLSHVIYTHRGYLVPRHDGRILAGSTTEYTGYDRGTSAEAIERLTRFANEMLPNTALTVTDTWAGIRPGSADGLPVLGEIPGLQCVTVASGHYRNGILLTPATAEIIADRIINNADHEEFSVFGMGRFSRTATASN